MKYRYHIFMIDTVIYSNYLMDIEGINCILDTQKKQYTIDGINWFKVEYWSE